MFIRTVFPSAIGHSEVAFPDAVNDVMESGYFGYWFDPSKDFILPAEGTLSLIRNKHIVPMGMELPVEFRKDEELFLRDLLSLGEKAEYAERIGIRKAATWIVPSHDRLSYEENFSLHVERLRKILDVLGEHGITLGLEFQGPKSLRAGKKHCFIHSLDGIFSLISALERSNCGIIMDVWHWFLSGAEYFDFNSFESGDQIVAVHICDAPSGLNDLEYQDLSRKLPCSTGVLDVGTFLKGVNSTGFAGPLLVEPFYSPLEKMSFREALNASFSSMEEAIQKRRECIGV